MPSVLRALPAGLSRAGVLSLIFALGVPACASQRTRNVVHLPPPSERTSVGAGDIFTLEIVGEKDLPHEYQIASDGTVDLPYIHTLKVAGLEPQEISRLVRSKLIENRILSNPTVVVQVKSYSSRAVTLLGQVVRPGSFTLTTGLTLIQAISLAGGFTAIADGTRVSLARRSDGKIFRVVVSVSAITEGEAADIPLQAGDQIFVRERIF